GCLGIVLHSPSCRNLAARSRHSVAADLAALATYTTDVNADVNIDYADVVLVLLMEDRHA
ncbi:hypothetical protein L7F22_054696, partial [Adiantum nelumboides]|nr:hypothetical protein [Adiantum nelumboides]